MANEGYHEPISELSDETRDMHRAITSLMEELEAVEELAIRARNDADNPEDQRQNHHTHSYRSFLVHRSPSK